MSAPGPGPGRQVSTLKALLSHPVLVPLLLQAGRLGLGARVAPQHEHRPLDPADIRHGAQRIRRGAVDPVASQEAKCHGDVVLASWADVARPAIPSVIIPRDDDAIAIAHVEQVQQRAEAAAWHVFAHRERHRPVVHSSHPIGRGGVAQVHEARAGARRAVGLGKGLHPARTINPCPVGSRQPTRQAVLKEGAILPTPGSDVQQPRLVWQEMGDANCEALVQEVAARCGRSRLIRTSPG